VGRWQVIAIAVQADGKIGRGWFDGRQAEEQAGSHETILVS
jgi:hypothetical protein